MHLLDPGSIKSMATKPVNQRNEFQTSLEGGEVTQTQHVLPVSKIVQNGNLPADQFIHFSLRPPFRYINPEYRAQW